MLYQPSFCCQCGKKIERLRKVWESNKFCEDCEKDFRQREWMQRIGIIAIGIFGIFGFGSYLKTPEKSLNLVSNQVSLNSSNKVQNVRKDIVSANNNQNLAQNRIASNNNSPTNIKSEPVSNAKVSEPNGLSDKTKLPLPTIETSSYCGAQTKKGTPCTRKVKGGGRCWQHTGLPAILPKEKLIVGKT